MDGTGELFRPLLEALGPLQKAIVISYPDSQSLSYTELESLVRSKLPQGPFVLLGESFSGPIAISIAATSPPGLRGVVLSCSFASNPRPLFKSAAPVLSLPLPLPPTTALTTVLLGKFSTSQLRYLLGQALKRVSPSVLRHRLAEVMSIDVSSKLKGIEAPLLYLQASSDWVVPRGAWLNVRNGLPNACVKVLNGPHLLLQAKPAESAAAIREFLSAISNAA